MHFELTKVCGLGRIEVKAKSQEKGSRRFVKVDVNVKTRNEELTGDEFPVRLFFDTCGENC